MNLENKKVLVLGGGISGCSTAWILKRLGADVSIVEMEEECGGIGKTHYLDGKRYEIGPHILHAKQDHTINFYKKYGARTIEYYAKMCSDDTLQNLIDFPYSVDSIFQLPRELGREVVKELFESRSNDIDQSNLETYLKSVVGETLYNKFNAGYSKKFWGKDPKEVPANGAASWINLRTDDKRLFSEWQAYPEGDFNSFMSWVKKGIPLIKAEVKGLTKSKSKIDAIETSIGDLTADLYISSLPLKSCFSEMSEDLSYVGNVLVAVSLEKGPVFPEGVGGIYFPSDKYKFKRVCEYPSMTDDSYPKLPDGTLLGFEYNVFPWKEDLPQDFYVNEVLTACFELTKQKPKSHQYHYYRDVYPIRDDEQMNKFSEIQEEVSSYKNFFLTGRFGNFRYVNMNDCIEMSFEVIEEITGSSLNTILNQVDL
tara:strand:- start:208 stop:1482 length:1275 start_codon:yes stop_codon:yes gene_type:complete